MVSGFLRLLRKRPVVGGLASVALHLALFSALMLLGSPWVTYTVKRGEPLFIELPQIDEPAPRGNPAAKTPGPPAPRPPKPQAAKAPPVPPAPAAPKPIPAQRPAPPAKPAEVAPRVASAPSPPKPEIGELPAPRPPAPEPARQPAPPAPQPVASEPARPAETPAASREEVAMAPTPRDQEPDIRSALARGGGGGGREDGRGGIEGEPIPLDSKDPKYSDYLDRVRRMIKNKWSYPCVKNAETHECEYKSAQLVIEFGIQKDGRVPFVTVRQSSGFIIMDDYAVNAIKLASPFPPVPDLLSKKGIPILASFHYVVDTSLVNLLR